VSSPKPFLFGKLPAHGDFVARGLDGAVRDAWDERASNVLRTARERLGDDFEDVFDAAPPWRFVCGPSSLGRSWRAGALAPSVDGAGRRFFIVLGVDALSASAAESLGADLAARSEAAIYAALSQGANADEVIQSAYSLTQGVPAGDEAEQPDAPGTGASRWWAVDENGETALSVASAELPADLLLRALEASVETP